MKEEPVVKAVGERISNLKGFLSQAICLLSNRVGHCKCTQENPCAECEADESFIRVVGNKVLKG